MTLKDRILSTIRAEYPGNLSHDQIATRLNANEATVRRVTQELRREGSIRDRYHFSTVTGKDTLVLTAFPTDNWQPFEPDADFYARFNPCAVNS